MPLADNDWRKSAPELANPGDRIGKSLDSARQDLIVVGRLLRKILEPAGISLIDEVEQRLAAVTCRVAVIGQIKAGKTCVINSLVGHPGLLPTDVNPSTSAITQLHFNQSSPSGDAAIFNFFTQEEWKSLANGSERLRSLTERFVPGFEPARLRQSVAVIRSRAATRLGPQYERLLGHSHAFGKVDPGTLSKYVCASDDGTEKGDFGLYSEITKSADLYFDDGPFEFPVTIIDTPGTNDPFLIRDEITRSALDKADAHLVVLSAQQPLAEGDVALLRILRGLQRDRIVVLVNRVDELDDAKAETPEIIEFVRNRLATEFPGTDIPIIAGSARLMEVSASRASANWTPTVASSNGVLQSESGMAELKAVLDELLATTQGAYFLRTIAGHYTDLAQVCSAVARDEIERLRPKTARSPAVSADRKQLQFDHETIAAAQDVIQRTAIDLEVRLRGMLKTDLDEQRTKLMELTSTFASDERRVLTATLAAKRDVGTWTCDVSGLYQALHAEFVSGFERSKSALASYASVVAVNLEGLINALMPGGAMPKRPAPHAESVPVPSPSALGRSLIFDIDRAVWWQFWRAKPAIEERGSELERLINEEFESVVDGLLASHGRALEDYIDTTTRWLLAVCHNILQMLQRQRDWLDANRGVVAYANGGSGSAELDRQTAEAVSDLEFRQTTADSALECLAAVHRNLERPSSTVGRALGP